MNKLIFVYIIMAALLFCGLLYVIGCELMEVVK